MLVIDEHAHDHDTVDRGIGLVDADRAGACIQADRGYRHAIICDRKIAQVFRARAAHVGDLDRAVITGLWH